MNDIDDRDNQESSVMDAINQEIQEAMQYRQLANLYGTFYWTLIEDNVPEHVAAQMVCAHIGCVRS